MHLTGGAMHNDYADEADRAAELASVLESAIATANWLFHKSIADTLNALLLRNNYGPRLTPLTEQEEEAVKWSRDIAVLIGRQHHADILGRLILS